LPTAASHQSLKCTMSIPLLDSVRKQIAEANEWRAGFSGAAHLAFQDVVERDFAVKRLVKVEAAHADDALAAAEGVESLVGESAIADEKAARPGGLLLDLAVERMKLGDPDRLTVPLPSTRYISLPNWKLPSICSPLSRKGSWAARPWASKRSSRTSRTRRPVPVGRAMTRRRDPS
jgi:hypothetical protein